MIVASFANTRARLQRLADAKFFAGWVESLSDNELRIRIRDHDLLQPGDECLFEAHGGESVASFTAILKLKWREEAIFSLTTPIRFRDAKEDPRRTVSGIRAILTCDGNETDADVLDISAGGLGALTGQALRRGQNLQLTVDTSHGIVASSGEVRYCKPDLDAPGHFRIGIQFREMGRLDRARWNRLFENAA